MIPKTENSVDDNVCAICLETIEIITPSKQLHCDHKFHTECINQWIITQKMQRLNPKCPLCKKELNASDLGFLSIAMDINSDHGRENIHIHRSIFLRILGLKSLYLYKHLWIIIYFFALISIDFRENILISLLTLFSLLIHIWQITLFIRYYIAAQTTQIPLNQDVIGAKSILLLRSCYIFIILMITKLIIILKSTLFHVPILICYGCDIIAFILFLIYFIDIISRYDSLIIKASFGICCSWSVRGRSEW